MILLNVDLALVGRAPREHPVGSHSPLSLSELSTNVVCALFKQKQRLEQEMFCEQGADAGYTWREDELKGVQKVTTENMHGLTYRCGLCLDVLQPYSKFASHLLAGQCRDKIDAGAQPSYELIYIDELPVCLHETRPAGPVEPGKKVRQEDSDCLMPKLERMHE